MQDTRTNNEERELIALELAKMHVSYVDLAKIRTKDGISLYRVFRENDDSYVIKYFQNESYRREIKNYAILQALGVQTTQIISGTDCALLMEDLAKSKSYRFGTSEDLKDGLVAAALAKWYKHLHAQGKSYISQYGCDLYDENDAITLENIEFIAAKTDSSNHPSWKMIRQNFEALQKIVNGAQRTLTYNDFNYTNLLVAIDKSTAFMYDYNLLGKGYLYADLRNVTSSLEECAKTAFLEEYGPIDENEKRIDDVASVLTTLYVACERDVLPNWSLEYVRKIKNGELMKAVEALLA